MMQATLMNFGSNTRVVNDIQNMPISIGVGQLVEANVHDVHYAMIRRAVATETLLIVPKEARRTPRLLKIMEILKGIETEGYDETLRAFNEVIPFSETRPARPSRTEMRIALMDHARQEVAAALRLQSKVIIHEQGDEVTRQPVERRDRPDGALEITVPEAKAPPPAPVQPDKPAKKAKATKRSQKPKKPVSKTRKRERL